MADSSKVSGTAGSGERLLTVPLRKEFLKVPANRRAKRSVKAIKSHLSRHMKAPESSVKLSSKLNEMIWIRGAAKPPGKIRIKAGFDSSTGYLHAMLPEENIPDKGKKSKPAKTESREKPAPEKEISGTAADQELKKADDSKAAEKRPEEAGEEKPSGMKTETPEKASGAPAKKAGTQKKPARSPSKKNKKA